MTIKDWTRRTKLDIWMSVLIYILSSSYVDEYKTVELFYLMTIHLSTTCIIAWVRSHCYVKMSLVQMIHKLLQIVGYHWYVVNFCILGHELVCTGIVRLVSRLRETSFNWATYLCYYLSIHISLSTSDPVLGKFWWRSFDFCVRLLNFLLPSQLAQPCTDIGILV